MKINILAAVLLALVSAGASAAITVVDSPFISSPTNVNTFASLTSDFPVNTVYSEGGINVKYVGTNDYAIANLGGDTPWYVNGGGYGYTAISLANNADLQNIQFSISSGWQQESIAAYRLLQNGTVVATGIANVRSGFGGYGQPSWLGFSGAGFNEVDIQVHTSIVSFVPDQYEAAAIGNISVAAVPEPETYAMLLAGLGLMGGIARRRKAMQA
jgi:hypothetical protein